jgi:hypothetical protein
MQKARINTSMNGMLAANGEALCEGGDLEICRSTTELLLIIV